jgi:competence protein ComEA
VELARARVLPALLVVTAGLGVATRIPVTGEAPVPCVRPARVGDRVICAADDTPRHDGWRDGRHEGADDRQRGGDSDLGGRAWLFGRKLDLNQASAADLQRIPGIGRSLAARIVDERTRRGRFARFEELDDVEGVGPKLLARLGALVEIR